MISRVYYQQLGDSGKKCYNSIIRTRELPNMRRFPIFPKGARVVRGPGFGPLSASGEVGTIVGRRNKTCFWVRWDSEPKKRRPCRGIWLRWAEES